MTTNQENDLSDENIRPEIANMPVEQMEAIVENHTPAPEHKPSLFDAGQDADKKLTAAMNAIYTKSRPGRSVLTLSFRRSRRTERTPTATRCPAILSMLHSRRPTTFFMRPRPNKRHSGSPPADETGSGKCGEVWC